MTYYESPFPHGVSCARCTKTLMPGGNDDQRVYELRVGTVGPDVQPWEYDERSMAVYELVCRACFEEAA